MLNRHITRFVIDEAHCFSAWGQDFRVDYLNIGDFIRELQEKKNLSDPIPVSCFTATAKQKVISDISDYFRGKLGLEMELFASGASRHNLRYEVLHKENDDEKYLTLRNLMTAKNCPSIVYVSKVKRTYSLATKLSADGIKALPFNGKMDKSEKVANQEKFMNGEVNVIVATSAFGMGVDKSDVGLVVHFDISASLEDYVQEAGRAGRDEDINAECYVLFKDEDLDGYFMMLNQSKLSIKEINQIWRAVKECSRYRMTFTRSALELARIAGWNDEQVGIETRVTNAINALETAGYVFLDFFIGKKADVFRLKSSDELEIRGDFLYANGKKLVIPSNAVREKLAALRAKAICRIRRRCALSLNGLSKKQENPRRLYCPRFG